MLQPLRKRKRGNNDREKRLPFQDVSILLYGSFPSPGPPKSDLAELLWAGGARQVTILGVVCLPLSEDAKVALVEVRGLLESTASEQQVILLNIRLKDNSCRAYNTFLMYRS